jgi:alpha/beta superfamily hydrolase
VRFNFRGVGASGRFDDGDGELDDLRAVVAWVRASARTSALWLAGFSFGAYVSLRAAAELQPPGADLDRAAGGPRWDFDAIAPPAMPWLVIQGEDDEIVDPQAVYDWVEARCTRRRRTGAHARHQPFLPPQADRPARRDPARRRGVAAGMPH